MNLLELGLFVALLAAVIARQVTGHGPPLWSLFAAGAFLTVAVGVLSPSSAEGALANAFPTIAFLFALFLFAGALQNAGAIDHLAEWLLGRAHRPEDLPFVLFLGFGLTSAVMVNDALVVIGVPLLLTVATRLRAEPKPLLYVMAFSVTVGSTLTPFGNPQNLLVAVASGVPSPVETFLRYLGLPTAINLLLGGWYVRRVYGRGMRNADRPSTPDGVEPRPLLPETGWRHRLFEHPVLWIFPGVIVLLVTLDVVAAATHGPTVPDWETAMAGAILLLLLTPSRSRALQWVNWPILVLFAGLFVVVAGAVSGGVVHAMQSILPIPAPGHDPAAILAISGTSLGATQLVSNVPWVALQIPVLSGLGYGASTPIIWMALAGASTLAGNVTLLGAASNLLVADGAQRRGVHIGLVDFAKHALPIAAITIAVLIACLWVGL
jgi:Na+/H+ antiporter NhaD/arsenite permease-like protein